MFHNTLRRVILNTSSLCYGQIAQASSAECPKFAVVLSGCGYLDGAEIHESVSVLSNLTRNKVIPHIFSLDANQCHVVNHVTGTEDSSHCRNMLSESSRIARVPVSPLEKLLEDFRCYSAVIFPGGFGVAKNFSNFASKGVDMEVEPLVKDVLQCFHSAKKPIGLICIAPILAAKVFSNVTITLGLPKSKEWPHGDAITVAEKMGARLELKDVHGVSADFKNMIFSTPAFMYNAEYHEVDDGINKLITVILATMTYRKN